MKQLCLFLSAVAFIPAAAIAQDAGSKQVQSGNGVEQPSITRSIALSELGFSDGISFDQLSGQSTLYVPIPVSKPLIAGTVTLDIKHGATLPVDRYLKVELGGRPVATHALGSTSETLSIPVPFDASQVSGGFLSIGLSYSGAFSDRVCIDERASGDFLEISPESLVTLSLDPGLIDTPARFAGFRPIDTRVTMSNQYSLGGLAAAIRAAALFDAETGHLSFDPSASPIDDVWSEAEIELDIATSGVPSQMQVERDSSYPVLRVRGTDPQLGLWQLFTTWSSVTGTEAAITTDISPIVPDTDLLPLMSLSADFTPRMVVATSDQLIPFQSSDLPEGKTVGAVSLILAAALDAEGRGATASVFLNNTLLGNRPLPSGQPERLNFDVPPGLIGRDNQLRVSIQRQPTGGECRFKPQGYPAQLLPGSALRLTDMQDKDAHFFRLRQSFGDGVQVVLDPALGMNFNEAIAWAIGIAGSMIPDRAPIIPRASVENIEPSLPFFVISRTSPTNETPMITFDQGRIEVRNKAGETMFSGEGLDQIGIAQIVTRGDQAGLWLRPGNGPAPEPTVTNPIILNRGDLALIGHEGVIVATSTRLNPVLTVTYPDQTSIAQILAKYRPWIIGAAWALLTLIVLGVFQRLYRNRRNGPTG